MTKTILIILTMFSLTACGQRSMRTPDNAMIQFEEFKKKKKFIEDNTLYYPGISDISLLPILNEKINMAADDMMGVAISENPTRERYQEKIGDGLRRFSDVYLILDTEDRERVCLYFEELMDIVGLESSNGQLNEFMYGFDPDEIKKVHSSGK